MSNAEIEAYLTSLQKSGLVTKEQMSATVHQAVKAVGEPGLSPELLASYFEKAGTVTPWHNEKLLKGKYKGFFLGNYKLLGHIATGGMSNIYLAEHVAMRRRVAIKVLPPTLTSNSSHLNRFYIESRVIASLDHPNIVRAYDVSQQGNFHYLVMEYVEGSDLRRVVQEQGVLSFETAAEFARQACEGLHHAHAKGLVHRDVKPANLLVDRTGTVKVLDMGLTRITDSGDPSLTLAHNEKLIGTVDYIAPEQAQNSHDVDARADIYSLGCTLYYLLTGQAPFNEGSQTQRLLSHATKEPISIRRFRPDLPMELEQICKKMMHKRRDHRYQSAGEAARDLSGWLASIAPSALPPPAHAPSHMASGPGSYSGPVSYSGSASGNLSGMVNQPQSGIAPAPPGVGGGQGSKLVGGGAGAGPGGQGSKLVGGARAGLPSVALPPPSSRNEMQAPSSLPHPGTMPGEVPSSLVAGKHDPEMNSAPPSGSGAMRLNQMLASRLEQLAAREAQLDQRQDELEAVAKQLEEQETRARRHQDEVRRAREQLTQLENYLEEKAAVLERRSEEVLGTEEQLAQREVQLTEWVESVQSRSAPQFQPPPGGNPAPPELGRKLENLDDFLEHKARMLEQFDEALKSRGAELDNREGRISQRESLCEVRHAMLIQKTEELEARERLVAAGEAPPSQEEIEFRRQLEELEKFLETKSTRLEEQTERLHEERRRLDAGAAELIAEREELDARKADLDLRLAAIEVRTAELETRAALYAEHEPREALLREREEELAEREAALVAREEACRLAAETAARHEEEMAAARVVVERQRAETAELQALAKQIKQDLVKRQEHLSHQADDFTAKARSVQKTLADLDRLKSDLRRREQELGLRDAHLPPPSSTSAIPAFPLPPPSSGTSAAAPGSNLLPPPSLSAPPDDSAGK